MKSILPTAAEPNSNETCQALFLPMGRIGNFRRGMTLLEAARQAGVMIESACGGEGWCGQCAVQILEGSFGAEGRISSIHHLSPMDQNELEELTARQLPRGSRLACLARLEGDVCVDVSGQPQRGETATDKELQRAAFEVDPIIRLCPLRLQPDASPALSIVEQAQAQLTEQYGFGRVEWDVAALRSLDEGVYLPSGEVTVTLWQERRVLRVQTGFQQRALGLAVDIGTTTLAVYLCDLSSGDVLSVAAGLNPQSVWGADIISRIAYCSQNTDGLARLQNAVVTAIQELAEQAVRSSGVQLEDVVDCVWAGNSVMLHLALGMNPASLGESPFTPQFWEALDLPASQVGLRLNPAARLHVLPLIAGYVGADAVAAILAAELHLREELTLLVDAGTNGELALGNRHGLVCTSSPTGPAFEGGNITFGVRAVRGAIERVRIDPSTRQVRFKVIGDPLWVDEQRASPVPAVGICGSGILEAVAEMATAGLLLPSGRFNPQASSPAWGRTEKGELVFVLAKSQQSASGKPIYLTQADIRAVQLAKAALRSGCDFLLKAQAVHQPQRIVLTGAFGSMLDPQRAMRIGMIPSLPLRQVQAVGNAAGEGACLALLNRRKREEARQIARQTRHVVMPTDPSFQEHFVAALAFPPLGEQVNNPISNFQEDVP